MKLVYTGEDWVFFRTVRVKVDDQVFAFTFDAFEVERDNGYGGVWEWVDVLAEGEYLRLARAITTSKVVRIRYEGDQYFREKTMGPGDRRAVSNVLDAFEQLKRR